MMNTHPVGVQDCSTLCDVQTDFSTIKLSSAKLKGRHLWNIRSKQKYYQVQYMIKMVIGAVSAPLAPNYVNI